MLCSDTKLDSHRFKDILDEAIAAGKLQALLAQVFSEICSRSALHLEKRFLEF